MAGCEPIISSLEHLLPESQARLTLTSGSAGTPPDSVTSTRGPRELSQTAPFFGSRVITWIVAVMVSLLMNFPGPGCAEVPTAPSPQEVTPAATVKGDVNKSNGQQPAAVKIPIEGQGPEVGTATNKQGTPSKTRTQPDERLSPVATEPIDKAGKKVGRKLDEMAVKSSRLLGHWVNSKAFNGITWLKLFVSVLMLLVVLLVERTLNRLIRRRLQRINIEERRPAWFEVVLEAVCKPLCLFIWVYGTYAALAPLFANFETPFGPNILKEYAQRAADTGGLVAVIWFVFRVVRLVDMQLDARAKSPESRIDDLQVSLIGKTLRWVIVIVGGIVVVQYVTGIQAAPVLASLGIGGLAVALAAKESIANLFGTVTIAFDRPFKVGDRIVIDKHDGFIESVGYRSTKLRLWSGNLVNIPNEKIISSSVENFARRPYILWRTDLTITYDTPPEKVDRAVEIVKEILGNDEQTSKELPPWVFFDAFNECSLNIRVTAWFEPEDQEPTQYAYYAWRERSCREILRRFNEEEIEFAFPTRTTYLANDDKRQLKIHQLMGDGPRSSPDTSDQ